MQSLPLRPPWGRLLLATPTLLLASILAMAPLDARAERVELSGNDVAIWNLAGEVEVVRGNGTSIIVEIDRGGSDADRIELGRGEIDGRQTLRLIYATTRLKYRPGGGWRWGSHTSVRVGPDGRFSDRSVRAGRRVSIGGSGLDAHANLRILVPDGHNVSLYLAVGSVEARGVRADLMLDTASAPVHADDITGNLTIDVGSGAVSVTRVTGDVNVDTGSGSVEVENVTGRTLVADTGSGRVSANRVRAERVSIDTGSGGVDLSDIMAADVGVDTGSGSVSIDLRSDVRSLKVDTGSGSVTVRLPGSVSAMVDVETGSGGISTDLPMHLTHKRRDSLRGQLGGGAGSIVIETGSGSVRLLEI